MDFIDICNDVNDDCTKFVFCLFTDFMTRHDSSIHGMFHNAE